MVSLSLAAGPALLATLRAATAAALLTALLLAADGQLLLAPAVLDLDAARLGGLGDRTRDVRAPRRPGGDRGCPTELPPPSPPVPVGTRP